MVVLPVLAYARTKTYFVDGITYFYHFEKRVTAVAPSLDGVYRGVIVIPDSVSLDGVTHSVDRIFTSAFFYCDVISVILPNTLVSIGSEAFAESDITSISIPDSVAAIPNMMCKRCESLETVTLGKSVNSLGNEVFGECSSLKKIISNAVTPPACDSCTFKNYYPQNCVLIVPKGSKASYQNAEGWNLFAQIFESEEEATDISATKLDHNANAEVYGLNGLRLDGQQKGLTIIRKNDGTVRKVMKR